MRVCQNADTLSFFCRHLTCTKKTNKIPTFSSKDFAKSQFFCNFVVLFKYYGKGTLYF